MENSNDANTAENEVTPGNDETGDADVAVEEPADDEAEEDEE